MATPPKSIGRALNFAASAVNRHSNAALAGDDLTLPQWVILSILWRDGPQGISDLAAMTGNNVPAASRIVDRMARRGLVLRHPVPGDRRQVRVAAAPGAEGLRHLARFYERVNDAALAGFTEDEVETLFRLLARIEANLSG